MLVLCPCCGCLDSREDLSCPYLKVCAPRPGGADRGSWPRPCVSVVGVCVGGEDARRRGGGLGGWREGRTTESSRSSLRGRWGLAPWRAQRSRFPSRAGAQTRTEPTDMGDMGPPLASPCAPHLLSRASGKHFVRTCHLYAQDPTRSEAHPPTELTAASSLSN